METGKVFHGGVSKFSREYVYGRIRGAWRLVPKKRNRLKKVAKSSKRFWPLWSIDLRSNKGPDRRVVCHCSRVSLWLDEICGCGTLLLGIGIYFIGRFRKRKFGPCQRKMPGYIRYFEALEVGAFQRPDLTCECYFVSDYAVDFGIVKNIFFDSNFH